MKFSCSSPSPAPSSPPPKDKKRRWIPRFTRKPRQSTGYKSVIEEFLQTPPPASPQVSQPPPPILPPQGTRMAMVPYSPPVPNTQMTSPPAPYHTPRAFNIPDVTLSPPPIPLIRNTSYATETDTSDSSDEYDSDWCTPSSSGHQCQNSLVQYQNGYHQGAFDGGGSALIPYPYGYASPYPVSTVFTQNFTYEVSDAGPYVKESRTITSSQSNGNYTLTRTDNSVRIGGTGNSFTINYSRQEQPSLMS